MTTYPDMTAILERKAAHRKHQAQLTFEEKIAIVNKWRKLTRQIRTNQRLSQFGQTANTEVAKDRGEHDV